MEGIYSSFESWCWSKGLSYSDYKFFHKVMKIVNDSLSELAYAAFCAMMEAEMERNFEKGC